MECLNELSAYYQANGITEELVEAVHTYVLLLAPFAPHIAEELWARMGEPYSVHQQAWPQWDEAQIAEETVTLAIQVNGRVRDRIVVPAGIAESDARKRALRADGVRRHVDGQRRGARCLCAGAAGQHCDASLILRCICSYR